MPSRATTPIAAWKLPLIVAAIAVSIVAGFYLGGPGLGMAIGALAASTIIVLAIRKPPIYPIEPPLPAEFRRHVLILIAMPLEDTRAIEALLRDLEPTAGTLEPSVLLAAPARHDRLARWTSDLEHGRERARQALMLSVASLAKAGIAARAHLSDEGIVQSAEDELRTFPATEVLLFPGPDRGAQAEVSELEARLTVPLRFTVPLRTAGKKRLAGDANPGDDNPQRGHPDRPAIRSAV
jgi:hypothetical protein